MIATSDLVNTVSQSTAAYLTLIRNQDKGNAIFHASDVRQAERKISLVENETLAILTPYNLQVPLICKELRRFQKHPEYHLIEVLNVHKSQGREWDSVFFSASDGALPGNDPFFADSNDPAGALVLNTAISRAKGHLRFFIDQQFWKTRRPQSLLTEIAQAG